MAAKTTNAELVEMCANQQKTITRALSRISALSDELSSLRNEVKRFKQDVSHPCWFCAGQTKGNLSNGHTLWKLAIVLSGD